MVKKLILALFLGTGLYVFLSYYQPVSQSVAQAKTTYAVEENSLFTAPIPQRLIMLATNNH